MNEQGLFCVCCHYVGHCFGVGRKITSLGCVSQPTSIYRENNCKTITLFEITYGPKPLDNDWKNAYWCWKALCRLSFENQSNTILNANFVKKILLNEYLGEARNK